MDLNEADRRLREFAEEVYADLGSGHSESVYENAMLVCLRESQLSYEHQRVVEIKFRGKFYVGEGYADIVVNCPDGSLIVELKALAAKIGPPEKSQLKKYMKRLNVVRGLLINFMQPSKTKSAKTELEIESIRI